jgi:hypothetical protein
MSPEQIAEVLAEKEGSPCRFVETAEVTERFKGKTVWTGEVLVFALKRPPDELCYAWIDPDAKSLVTVLNRPPVDSPATAVRAYIASKAR